LKKLSVILLAVAAVISAGFAGFAAGEETGAKVTAYYFHGTFRCQTCTLMESYSRAAIENNFKAALDSGQLAFRPVNIESQDNTHFVNDYQLYTKALILSLTKDGKEVKSKNLDKIWQYVRNRQKFSDYVVAEVNDFLKEAQ